MLSCLQMTSFVRKFSSVQTLLLFCVLQTVMCSTKQFTLILERQLLPGFSKLQVTVNGTVPGPSLRVTLGDKVVVNVINNIFDDAATVHWHGMTMRGTPWSDGIVNITQCPISNLPGNNTLQYIFTPDRAGTFFYHGHYHEQQQDGLYGALIVMDNNVTQNQFANTGVSYDVDEDEWVWIVSDWYAVPAARLVEQMMAINSGGADPVPDAFTVNNKFTGRYNMNGVRKNETTRVRVIHAGTHSFFSVSVDGLPLTLIELDGVAVEPLILPYIRISVAQRVSFLLNWTALSSNLSDSDAVWFRFTADKSVYPQSSNEAPYYNLFGTASGLPLNLEWKGSISFSDATVVPSYRNATPPILAVAPAVDLNILQARPLVHAIAPNATYFIEAIVTFNTVDGYTHAYLNGATALMSASQTPQLTPSPMLYRYLTDNGGPLMEPVVEVRNNLSYITGSATMPFVLPFNETIEVFISACCGDHPFHLHGHHFWIVASSDNEAADTVYADNYLVRDMVIVPSNGWVRIRFVADNPGVWWFHCHLHWHLNMGLVATMIEAPQKLSDGAFYNTLVIPPSDRHVCSAPVAFNFSTTPNPSIAPTVLPSSVSPSTAPSLSPSKQPSFAPTSIPSAMPSEAPTGAPSVHPSFRPSVVPTLTPTVKPTHIPTTGQPSVGLISSITLTFQSVFTIDGLLPVLNDADDDGNRVNGLGFVDWCVVDSAAQSLGVESSFVTLVNTTATNSNISPQAVHRQLVPLLDATTTTQRTIRVTVTSGQFPHYTSMSTLYEQLVYTLQQSAISGNYSDFLKEHLLLSHTSEEVKDVQLIALAISAAVIHYPVVTAYPSFAPSSASSGGDFYYSADDTSSQGDDIVHMNRHTKTLVIATTTAGAIVLLIVVYEMWKRSDKNKRKSIHSITAIDNIEMHETNKNVNDDYYMANNRVNNASRATPLNKTTTGATDPATQTTDDAEQGGFTLFDDTADDESSHRSPLTSPDENTSSKRYYVLERERHVSFSDDKSRDWNRERDRDRASPEGKSEDQNALATEEGRHLSRQLKVVDGDSQVVESSAYSYRAEEPWRLRWIG